MAREGESSVSPLWRELFQSGIYKRSQGRITRQVTFAVLAGTLLIGAWRYNAFSIDGGLVHGVVSMVAGWFSEAPLGKATSDALIAVDQYVIPVLFSVLGVWVCFRAVNYPRFADFLIAVEAEMNKVSWPSRPELMRSTAVVLITIFALAGILYVYDSAWRLLLWSLGVVG